MLIFIFSTNHLHYKCCFVFPLLGVSLHLPITHIHYFGDKSCLEQRGAQFVSVTALGTDSSLSVTYLPLPLAFSVSKHEMFS